MTKLGKIILSSIIGIVLITLIMILNSNRSIYIPDGELNSLEIKQANNILKTSTSQPRYTYEDYLNDNESKIKYNNQIYNAELQGDNILSGDDFDYILMEKGVKAKYVVDITEEGFYHINLNYLIDTKTLNEITISIKINGNIYYEEMSTIELPLNWQDETKNYDVDRYGDEVVPNQINVSKWKEIPLFNNTYSNSLPLLFWFDSDENIIEIESVTSSKFNIGEAIIFSPEKIETYQNYLIKNNAPKINDTIKINAIDYKEKNSSYIQPYALMSKNVYPMDPVYKKLNIIDGNSWNQSGQSITYQVNVKEAGLYNLSLHYSNEKTDFSVFRSIYINGNIPFKEAMNYEFKPTKYSKWENETINYNGENLYFYLKNGTNEITLKAESSPLSKEIRDIQLIVDHINYFSLEIRKITGREIDKDRTWVFSLSIPETKEYLESYIITLKKVITNLEIYSPKKHEATILANIQKAIQRLDKILKDYDRMPLYLDDLSGGESSVALFLGNALNDLKEQPLSLDYLYIHNDFKLPRANANFFVKLWSSIVSFFSSFTSDKYKTTKDDNTIEVWVNRPITYVDMIQKMADKTFHSSSGVKVKVSVMPDPNKLVLASAADQQPDVALGLASHIPYDLAIRNAAYDLSTFDNYWEFANNFAPGAFIPYIINDSVYAIPETLDFNVLIYRTDIIEALNINIPNTWYEVIDILSELQQYGMNFYHPIAGGDAIKWFYQTSGFIYQFGGSLYTEDGLRTTINSKEAVEGLTFLTKLFTNYSLPEQVQSFYNSFRYATIPIGIVDFNNYQMIKNAAPELTGKWAIAPYPSITTDGVENRHFIANGTASMVMKDTKYPTESWEFLQWWLSEDTQSQFAFDLQSTYGPTYAWLSGNIKAFEKSPFSESDREIILNQVEWLVDVPRTPGQYMLERSLSDIWNTSVFDSTITGVAIDNKTITINREIRKKMIEFMFLDQNGNVLKPYIIRDINWVKEQMRRAGDE